VSRIYAIKRRPDRLELTILAASIADVEDDVEFSAEARILAAAYWPGALSIVSPLRGHRWAVPREGSTLSVRVPDHPIALELLRRIGPLATTSANRHGEPAADTAAGIAAALGSEVDLVLDGGPSAGLASTIIDCTTTNPRVPPRRPDQAPARCSRILGAFQQPPRRGRDRSDRHSYGYPSERPGGRFHGQTRPARHRSRFAALLDEELERQEDTLELIPSENLASVAVLEGAGLLAQQQVTPRGAGQALLRVAARSSTRSRTSPANRAKALFGAEHPTVQPHSGTERNMAVLRGGVLTPGDKVLGMALDQGGHLSHGSPVSFSGKIYHFEPYFVDETTGILRYGLGARSAPSSSVPR